HRPATQNVQMEMKYCLPAVRIGVHHDPIALGRDPGLLRYVARESQEPSERRGVLRIVQRADVSRGDDQEMRRSLGVHVLEGHHAVAPLDDLGRDLAEHDLAEHTSATGHRCPSARRIVSQHLPLSFSGGASSTSLSFSSSLRCSAVSLVGVQTWMRTCRSPWPPSPRRVRPLARRRYAIPVCVPAWTRSVVWPNGVRSCPSAPSAARVKVMPRS